MSTVGLFDLLSHAWCFGSFFRTFLEAGVALPLNNILNRRFKFIKP